MSAKCKYTKYINIYKNKIHFLTMQMHIAPQTLSATLAE